MRVLFVLQCASVVTQFFARIIAPSYCVQCQVFSEQGSFLCKPCFGTIRPIVTKTLTITEKYSAQVFAASAYVEPLRSLVVVKHYGNRLASKQLAELLWNKSDLRFADFDILVPVPLHWTRYAWRWFNQAEVMATTLSALSGKPVVHLLKRKRKTNYQTGLTREKRLTNLADAFELTPEAQQYKGKRILLIDDVMTTGTTLKLCSQELIKIRPFSLIIGVACRT